jgi:hypothetical protein
MKFGLVELYVHLHGIREATQTNAVMQGIRRDPDRANAVRRALDEAKRADCSFVLFPGWTLVEDGPPAWLLALSAGRTVVFEYLAPDRAQGKGGAAGKGQAAPAASKGRSSPDDTEVPSWCSWRSCVAVDGRLVVGPAPQYVAEAPELWGGEDLSPRGSTLVQSLQRPGPDGRRWTIPGVGAAMLVVCGEVNFVGGGGPADCYNWESVEAAGLTEEGLAGVRCVVNPAHTLSSLQALRDKRAWLSRGGLLLQTANIHSGGWEKTGESGSVPGRASHEAARAWVRREPYELREEGRGEGYVLKTCAWAP